MLSLSAELTSKGKLLKVANLHLLINSADKPNIRLLLIFPLSFDWLKALYAFVLIGQNDYFEFD